MSGPKCYYQPKGKSPKAQERVARWSVWHNVRLHPMAIAEQVDV
jgi:hypothetical protein